MFHQIYEELYRLYFALNKYFPEKTSPLRGKLSEFKSSFRDTQNARIAVVAIRTHRSECIRSASRCRCSYQKFMMRKPLVANRQII